MAKGDDVLTRKKNKANRKKLQRKNNDSSSVSARVAALIAAKKRRKSGKRRICQGMCFSLPTPDDPFNDLHGKQQLIRKDTKKRKNSLDDEKVMANGKNTKVSTGTSGRNCIQANSLLQTDEVRSLNIEQKKLISETANVKSQTLNNDLGDSNIKLLEKCDLEGLEVQGCESLDFPSKFLIMCLNSIENVLRHDVSFSGGEGKPLFGNPWGAEFWKFYSTGKSLLDSSGNCSTVENIAWMVSSAADTIARKEKEGLSLSNPFLLFLVPSQEKALKVRSVCKPLKPLGIHTVSIHPGASIDHQIQGLKSCEPEFLVSTPERLLELISLKAIDISGISMLVIDGLDPFAGAGYLDLIKQIRLTIPGNPHTVVFNDCNNSASISVVQDLLTGPIHRIHFNDSIASLSTCIIQSVNVCTSEQQKILKSIQALDQASSSQSYHHANMLFVINKESKHVKLVTALKGKGYTVSFGSTMPSSDDYFDLEGKRRKIVSLIYVEDVLTADIGKFNLVFLPNFVHSIERYVHVLTRMARHSVKGVLHSYLTREDKELAGPLIEVLEQCGKKVPEALRNLSLVSL